MRTIFISSIFIYSCSLFAKTLVFSDIDDTIKKAYTMGGVKGYPVFLKKVPFLEMRDLFIELQEENQKKGEDIGFFYVSAAPYFTFNGDEWIKENHFPKGPVILKTLKNGGPTFNYKYLNIKKIIEEQMKKETISEVIFFGDNSQHDADVYYKLNQDLKLNAQIYIRDVSTEATYFADDLKVKRLEGVHYFFSEIELLGLENLGFISENLEEKITKAHLSKKIIPLYVLQTLEDRIEKKCEMEMKIDDLVLSKGEQQELKKECRIKAKALSMQYWDNYFKRSIN